MTTDSFIYVRNTVSGVTEALTVDEAAHILSHEHFKKFHVVVDKPKDEVLAQPYQVDGDGNRTPIESPAEKVPADEVIDEDETKEDGE